VSDCHRSTATQAAINLHAWVEEDISRGQQRRRRSRVIIFGPTSQSEISVRTMSPLSICVPVVVVPWVERCARCEMLVSESHVVPGAWLLAFSPLFAALAARRRAAIASDPQPDLPWSGLERGGGRARESTTSPGIRPGQLRNAAASGGGGVGGCQRCRQRRVRRGAPSSGGTQVRRCVPTRLRRCAGAAGASDDSAVHARSACG